MKDKREKIEAPINSLIDKLVESVGEHHLGELIGAGPTVGVRRTRATMRLFMLLKAIEFINQHGLLEEFKNFKSCGPPN